MRSYLRHRWFVVGLLLALPALAHAQEATLTGTVSDTTGAALPGVTVRAVNQASGNSFDTITDGRGEYRLAVRVGAYKVTAELSGFQTATKSLEVLVGQAAIVNLQMGVSGVAETVTVTGEAPLLNTTGSAIGGNIDPVQMQALPVNGRDWMQLVLLAPGATGNGIFRDPINAPGGSNSDPLSSGRVAANFQVNVDGQEITVHLATNQPTYSRDAIAEMEFIPGRFDATQGRSMGVQVNAITKSGTNLFSGSFGGYFRDATFNAADFIAKEVIPYQDQQLSGTFGGPLVKDRLHIFGNYEYENNPNTLVFQTPYPFFNLNESVPAVKKIGGVRLDGQFSSRTRLMVRVNGYKENIPPSGSNSQTPSSLGETDNNSLRQVYGVLSQVLSNRAVNEIKVGYATFFSDLTLVHPPSNPNARFGFNAEDVVLAGFTAGGTQRYPISDRQTTDSIRDDFTYSFTKHGRHTLKVGGEYLFVRNTDFRCNFCEGELTANLGPINAQLLQAVFPNQFDATTWNLALLSPITFQFSKTFVNSDSDFTSVEPRYETAMWVQDDWTISPRLTLNLGLRYDILANQFDNARIFKPFYDGSQPGEYNNFGPRVGFSYSPNDRTVIRGGGGKYYGAIGGVYTKALILNTLFAAFPNDGRPDFASNPFNGPQPTYAQILARACTTNNVPGCLVRNFDTSNTVFAPNETSAYAWQGSIGLQRQVGATTAIQADYFYSGPRDYAVNQNVNLSYNPATGINNLFSNVALRPYTDWGTVQFAFPGAHANQHALQTGFTKRFSRGWEASGTYTVSVAKDQPPPPHSGLDLVPFPLAADLAGPYVYTNSVGDQRHRVVANAVWRLPYDFQLSGLYSFGSGERFSTSVGQTQPSRGSGITSYLRRDGTVMPRNNFVGLPIHRVDLRLQRQFRLSGRARVDGIIELFNALNHANYGSYTTSEVSPNYGLPQQGSQTTAYTPRSMQLGFRVAF